MHALRRALLGNRFSHVLPEMISIDPSGYDLGHKAALQGSRAAVQQKADVYDMFCWPCRYTAGVYSHIPGGLAALPKFDEGSDFKIPANVVKGEPLPAMLMEMQPYQAHARPAAPFVNITLISIQNSWHTLRPCLLALSRNAHHVRRCTSLDLMPADSRRVGCLGLTDAVEAESSSGSESNSPRHPDSGTEQVRLHSWLIGLGWGV